VASRKAVTSSESHFPELILQGLLLVLSHRVRRKGKGDWEMVAMVAIVAPMSIKKLMRILRD